MPRPQNTHGTASQRHQLMDDKLCDLCGAVFPRLGKRGPLPKCCKNCRTLRKAKALKPTCQDCGAPCGWSRNTLRRFPRKKCDACLHEIKKRRAAGPRQCRRCDRAFIGSTSASFCTDCRPKAKVVVCLNCGGKFKRSRGGGNSKGLFCSRKCSGAGMRARNAPRHAEKQKRKDAARRARHVQLRKYEEEQARRYIAKFVAFIIKRAIACCDECGGPLPLLRGFGKQGGGNRLLLCGKQCQNRRVKQRMKKRGHGTSPRHTARARRLGLPRQYGRCMSLASIGARDGWTCGICRKPIEVRAGSNTLRHSASVDHVVALSHPGNRCHGHTPDNVQIAHRICNERKGCRLQYPSLLDAIHPLQELRRLQALDAEARIPGGGCQK